MKRICALCLHTTYFPNAIVTLCELIDFFYLCTILPYKFVHLVIQDRKGVCLTETGAQEVEEKRVLINSEEYKCFMKECSIKV